MCTLSQNVDNNDHAFRFSIAKMPAFAGMTLCYKGLRRRIRFAGADNLTRFGFAGFGFYRFGVQRDLVEKFGFVAFKQEGQVRGQTLQQRSDPFHIFNSKILQHIPMHQLFFRGMADADTDADIIGATWPSIERRPLWPP